jgi:AcrR family transcriptional regulator
LLILSDMTSATSHTRHPIDARADRILASALDEFARRGFTGARETVIARRAGVSAATLRLYFPSKDELFREVIRSAVVTALRTAGPATTGEGDAVPNAEQRVQGIARGFWQSMEEPGRAALLHLSVGELPRYPELALFHATEVLGRTATRLERALADGVAAGELRVFDPRATARVILSALVTHAHWFAFPNIYSGITGADRDRAETAVLEVLLESLRPSGVEDRRLAAAVGGGPGER